MTLPDTWPKRPDYVYNEDTTLNSLVAEFLTANGKNSRRAAGEIGVKPETFQQWERGNWTEGLKTRFFSAFCRITGIDLDRLMVIEAKRGLFAKDSSLRNSSTWKRLNTRNDVVTEIRRIKSLPSYDGTRLIAWQIPGIPEETINQWTNGRTKPEGNYLDLCLVALSRGLIESGTRNDLALRLSMRRICGMEIEESLSVSTFEGLMNAVFTRGMRALSPAVVADRTGIARSTAAKLLEWTPASEASYPYATMFALVRLVARQRWDDASLERFERARVEFLDQETKAYTVRTQVKPVMRSAERPVVVEHPEPELKTTPQSTEPTRATDDPDREYVVDDGVARLAEFYRTQLLELAARFPNEVGMIPIMPGLEIGETVHEVHHCLTGANIPDVGDWDPTDAEIQAMARSIKLVRRAYLIVLAMPVQRRNRVMATLGPELDELFLADRAKSVEDIMYYANAVNLERQGAEDFYKRKGRK
jgi:hypothetical protein